MPLQLEPAPEPACLAGGTGCETVAKSSYSHILGINVSIIGLAGWLLILGTVLWGNDYARLGGFLFTLGGFGFSIYLTYLEIWKIEAICQWCVANATLMTIAFLLNARTALAQFRPQRHHALAFLHAQTAKISELYGFTITPLIGRHND